MLCVGGGGGVDSETPKDWGSGPETRGKEEEAAGWEAEEEDSRGPGSWCGHQRTWGPGGVSTGKGRLSTLGREASHLGWNLEADGKKHFTPWIVSRSYQYVKEGHGQTAARRNRLWKDRYKRGKRGTVASEVPFRIPCHLILSNLNSLSHTYSNTAFWFKIEVVSLITFILLILIRSPILKISLSLITYSFIYLLIPFLVTKPDEIVPKCCSDKNEWIYKQNKKKIKERYNLFLRQGSCLGQLGAGRPLTKPENTGVIGRRERWVQHRERERERRLLSFKQVDLR